MCDTCFPTAGPIARAGTSGIDANQLQPFLAQSITATTPLQLTDDARTFLVGQGVSQATIDQAVSDIAALQNQSSVVVGQGQGQGQGGIDWKIAVAIALILAAVLLAFLASGAAARSAAADSTVDCRGGATGPWTGLPIGTEAGLNAAYRVLPTRRPMPTRRATRCWTCCSAPASG